MGKEMYEKTKWLKPELTLINIKQYEKAILANANSGCAYGCGGVGGCTGSNCGWNVTCTAYTR